ncbi:leucine-rich repeat and guanylate kinase domain-containing protein [Strongylocentrotus purpuratus]|uniref:Guanylate kinase-like domain-containing protein n=1 Tax=Strongylocentrotus purpuratus TaxID=7668 RepID=A0A7M7RBZ1_STRPU|nr:leucine-rich repeat and guanylate kinase domain-containing protein [Strongylocentrotus purpuratus]
MNFCSLETANMASDATESRPQTVSFSDLTERTPENLEAELVPEPPVQITNNSNDVQIDSDGDEAEEQEPCPDGILNEQAIEAGLSNLGRSADGMQLTFLNLTLPGYNLQGINILENYVHLQKVELPYNRITDITVLGCMPYLVELDVSHNEITNLLDFKPPFNLQEVDVSFNKITEMGDLSAHHALTKLVLDNNQLSTITGIENCRCLHHLGLAHNNISVIEKLDHLPLRFINLRCNQISIIENLDTLTRLQYLDLSGNEINSLEGLQKCALLETLDLENNQVADITDLQYIEGLKLLRHLTLLRNPIQDIEDYRLSLLFRIPQMVELDRHRVEVEEKIAAVNLFEPPMEVIAAQDHRRALIYSSLKQSKVLMSTLPSIETPYPVLVLVGPRGSGKQALAQRLVKEFTEYFGLGLLHTTRGQPTGGEKDYHYVSSEQFEELLQEGEFLLTYQIMEHRYGLSLQAIESVAENGLACVITMELEGVLTMKLTHFQPRYVLLLPLDQTKHEQRLQAVGNLSNTQVQFAVDRTNLYQHMHQNRPGFFDRSIDTTDPEMAFKLVRNLVLSYLGLEVPDSPEPSSQEQDSSSIYSPSQTSSAMRSETHDSPSFSQSTGRQQGPPGIVENPPSPTNMRTWMKPVVDPPPRPLSQNSKKRQEASMSAIEKISYERRKSAAKEAVSGIVPRPLDQLINEPPSTAPGKQFAGLGDDPTRPKTVPNSAVRYLAGSPDSSVATSRSDSRMSGLSDARGMSASPSGSQTSFQMVGGSDGHASRPGSVGSLPEDRPVLPPILTGQN